jgi:hypothetical protein
VKFWLDSEVIGACLAAADQTPQAAKVAGKVRPIGSGGHLTRQGTLENKYE